MVKVVKPASEWDLYVKADKPAKARIIGASFGEVGTLKTSFWLGAPGPIVVLSFDKGLEGVVEPFQDLKDIYVKEFDWVTAPGHEPDQKQAIDMADEFTEVYEHAIHHARTVIVDKETDMFSVFKYAEFGAPEKGRPDDWDKLKAKIRRLFNMPKALDINFGLIQGMKNEWKQQLNMNTGKQGIAQTGNRVRSGMDDVDAIVYTNIEHFRDAKTNSFMMNVGKSRGPGGRDIQYTTLPFLTFPELGQLIFPETQDTPEVWE